MTRQYMIAAFAVAACALALSAEAIDMSWTGKWQPCEKINLTDITTTPIGDTLLDDGGFELPTNATCIAQCNVPPELSEGGACGALRVSGLLVECRTRSILGAMGSYVYPSVSEGAFAVTNYLQAAVVRASDGKAVFAPLRRESDGSGTITYEWEAGGRQVEFVVKCFVNAKRQMAVCTYIHTKGDSINCRMSE